MIKRISFIAPGLGIGLLLFCGAVWLQPLCPGRVAAVMATTVGAPEFKPYHAGANPWVGTWLPVGAALATPDPGHQPRVAEHSARPHSCERDSEAAKPGLSS
jgi:hypothetical protein